jgi:transcriptional regulator with XRE-family HTH domain
MTDPMNDLGALVLARQYCADGRAREIRQAARLSLADMARAVGCSLEALSRWERGERRPTRALAVRFGRVLIDLEQQLSREPS